MAVNNGPGLPGPRRAGDPLRGLPPPPPPRSPQLSLRTTSSSGESKRLGRQRDQNPHPRRCSGSTGDRCIRERSRGSPHSKREGLASRPRITSLPPSVMPVNNPALKPRPKDWGQGRAPPLAPSSSAITSQGAPLRWTPPGVSSPSVLGPSPTSPACSRWKKGKEICLFLFVYEKKNACYRKFGNTGKPQTRKQKLPTRSLLGTFRWKSFWCFPSQPCIHAAYMCVGLYYRLFHNRFIQHVLSISCHQIVTSIGFGK